MVEVQGWVIAGGLMLVWPFDIIIAADDTKFTDPVVALGVNGVEYFAHPWEFGTRKAKEMLFTGEVIMADEAKSLGMVKPRGKPRGTDRFHHGHGRKYRTPPNDGAEASQAVCQPGRRSAGTVFVTAGCYEPAATRDTLTGASSMRTVQQ